MTTHSSSLFVELARCEENDVWRAEWYALKLGEHLLPRRNYAVSVLKVRFLSVNATSRLFERVIHNV